MEGREEGREGGRRDEGRREGGREGERKGGREGEVQLEQEHEGRKVGMGDTNQVHLSYIVGNAESAGISISTSCG